MLQGCSPLQAHPLAASQLHAVRLVSAILPNGDPTSAPPLCGANPAPTGVHDKDNWTLRHLKWVGWEKICTSASLDQVLRCARLNEVFLPKPSKLETPQQTEPGQGIPRDNTQLILPPRQNCCRVMLTPEPYIRPTNRGGGGVPLPKVG